jgi:hypothetical protein
MRAAILAGLCQACNDEASKVLNDRGVAGRRRHDFEHRFPSKLLCASMLIYIGGE